MIFGAFGFILHRPIHEDQNQGMKDMHPWNVDLHNKPEKGVIDWSRWRVVSCQFCRLVELLVWECRPFPSGFHSWSRLSLNAVN